MSLLCLEGAKVRVSRHGWHPQHDQAPVTEVPWTAGGAGQGHRASERQGPAWSPPLALALLLLPVTRLWGLGPGTLYGELLPQTGEGASCSKLNWGPFSGPCDRGPLPGTGKVVRCKVDTPTTSGWSVPPSDSVQRGRWAGGRSGRERGAAGPGRRSQLGPEEPQGEQEPRARGPGTPRRGWCPVAQTSGTALPGELVDHVGTRKPLVLHVGVGAPGGAAFADQQART